MARADGSRRLRVHDGAFRGDHADHSVKTFIDRQGGVEHGLEAEVDCGHYVVEQDILASRQLGVAAAQVEFDVTYGILYGYVWGSNTDFGENIELDYGLGITPKWGPITFNFAGLYYSYPGANDEIDYFEALGGASGAA